MLKIAVYGKGGIGKSTTVSNLSSAFARMGLKVMQIGCDPKADSTRGLLGGKRIPTILDTIREGKPDIKLEDLVFEGADGVLCAEAGGPTPGRGCAGKGIVTAFEQLNSLNAYQIYSRATCDVHGVCDIGVALDLKSRTVTVNINSRH